MRHTRAHSKNRRSHHALKAPELSVCAHCQKEHRPHHMCLHCGYYNGRQVIDLEASKAKRDARMRANKERASSAGNVMDENTKEALPAPKEEVKGEQSSVEEKPKKKTTRAKKTEEKKGA